jgi:hypothetical protein
MRDPNDSPNRLLTHEELNEKWKRLNRALCKGLVWLPREMTFDLDGPKDGPCMTSIETAAETDAEREAVNRAISVRFFLAPQVVTPLFPPEPSKADPYAEDESDL